MPTFILITGASSGIGRAAAEKFATEGRNLILVARRFDRLQELKAKLEKNNVEVRIHELDVTDRAALDTFFADLKNLTIDVIINNAGLALGTQPFDQYDFADIDTMIDTNIRAMTRVAFLGLPFLKKSNGHLINLGSIAGMQTYAGGTIYCATKHFVHAFSQGLRKDLLGSDVRVTIVAPGRVETEFSEVRMKGDKSANSIYREIESLQPSDIADAMWYAVSAPKHVNLELLLVMPTHQAAMQVKK